MSEGATTTSNFEALRPRLMTPDIFQGQLSLLAQAQTNNDAQGLAAIKSVYTGAGGTEEGWAQLVAGVAAQLNPDTGMTVNPPAGPAEGAPVTAASTSPTDTEVAQQLANKPGMAAAEDTGPKWYGMHKDWAPADGELDRFYQEGAEFAEVEELSLSSKKILKEQMFASGVYGPNADPAQLLIGTSQWTEADDEAVRFLMAEANKNKTTWRRALMLRVGSKSVYDQDAELTPEEEAALVDGGLSFQQSLRQFADANGLKLSDDWIRMRYEQSLDGKTSLEQVQQKLREKYVAPTFPAWKDDILSGMNVKEIAEPYTNQMEAMLDMPPGSIDLDDPLVRSALQGVGEDGKPGYVPMYQFEHQVRKDPRWADSIEGMNAMADNLGAAYDQMMEMF